MTEAVTIYARQIIQSGYTLVFGDHPTFQQIIFEIGELYSYDVTYSIEMHMDKTYAHKYNLELLNTKCHLVLSDGLHKMRENMICRKKRKC